MSTNSTATKNIIFVTGNGIGKHKELAKEIAANLYKSVLISQPYSSPYQYQSSSEYARERTLFFSKALFYGSLPSRRNIVVSVSELSMRVILQFMFLFENIKKNIFVVVDDRYFITSFSKDKFMTIIKKFPIGHAYFFTDFSEGNTSLSATVERLIESDIIKKTIGTEEDAQNMLTKTIMATCKDEYLDIMLQFVDLSTVDQRIDGKTLLTREFVGKYHGWTRMTLIPMEFKDNQIKKLVITSEIIDSEKNELMNLIYKSTTDELTRLYNRRSYEEELNSIIETGDMKNLIIIAMDLNGLKTINDTIGHEAGDEMIIGVSKCIEKAFNMVGKVYRTGGDEFMAILRCEKEKLPEILSAFDDMIKEWSGNLVESLSVSYGYVAAIDYPDLAVRDLVSEADKLMYKAKSAFYKEKGIERRRTS